MQTKYSERGQVLLVVVLIITIVLTVSLSVLARSVVNSRLSSEEDQSVKALSAAEAGIERTLIVGAADTKSLTNGTAFTTTNTQIGGIEFLLNNGRLIEKDEGADIWLSTYASGVYGNKWTGTMTVYWGLSDTCGSPNTSAAIEILLITDSGTPSTSHYVYDPCSRGNNFSSPTTVSVTISGKTFKYASAAISVAQGIVARVIPLYQNAYIGVKTPGPSFPLQGVLIESTGTAGEVKRKISLFQENPSLPTELFMYTFLWPKKFN